MIRVANRDRSNDRTATTVTRLEHVSARAARAPGPSSGSTHASGAHATFRPSKSSCLLALALLIPCGLIGCGQNQDSATAATASSNDDALRAKTERGPLTATVDVSPEKPRLSDLLTVTLTVTAPDNIEVKLPEFRSAFTELVVRDFQDPLPNVAANQRTLKQVYKLEPLVAGQLVIPSFTITYKDKDKDKETTVTANSEANVGELITDELKFNVETIVDVDSLSLDALKPAAAPIALPKPATPFPWLQWLVGAISIIAAATVWWLRSKRIRPEDLPSPNEVATRELNQLVSNQSARADLRTFYVQLTGIVRRYIEAVTDVNAAEQTTEEFLSEMQDKRLFSDSSNQRLQEFLEASDLIKFAGQTPDSEAVEDSIIAARQFIRLPPVGEVSLPESDATAANH